ncbi:hypothetical protein BGX27_011146 [Mortierella sp. AM989]|nr:hypothetical protein BGX27_011146 [Mortierella sp. AM989]
MAPRLSASWLPLLFPLLALTFEGIHPVPVRAAPTVSDYSMPFGLTEASIATPLSKSSILELSNSPSQLAGFPRYEDFDLGMLSSGYSQDISGPPRDETQKLQMRKRSAASIATNGGSVMCYYDPATAGLIHCSDGATYQSLPASTSRQQRPESQASDEFSEDVKQPLKKRSTSSIDSTMEAPGAYMPARPLAHSTPFPIYSKGKQGEFITQLDVPTHERTRVRKQKRSSGLSDSVSSTAFDFGGVVDRFGPSPAAFKPVPDLHRSWDSSDFGVENWGHPESNLGENWNMNFGQPDLGGDWSKYNGGFGYDSGYGTDDYSHVSSCGGSNYDGSGCDSNKRFRNKRSVVVSPSRESHPENLASRPNVVPVPIDIDALVHPDGRMTLMPAGGISAIGGLTERFGGISAAKN